MNRRLRFRHPRSPDVVLCSIERKDNPALRTWKNRYRESFFHTRVITPAQQERWFAAYLRDAGNHMFMILYRNRKIGCAGFKLRNGHADIYNVILGSPAFARKGIMSRALEALLAHLALQNCRGITLKVLSRNRSAIKFYLKNGFHVQRTCKGYLLLRLPLRTARGILSHE
jgi:RimJ/RimL family protein N-acetyltransferase